MGTSGPSGLGTVEDVFLDYFASQGLQTEPTEFDGRSDYEALINAGIPAGGLFSGAEDIKTAEQAAIYGGTAGTAYDACYHQACDDLSNLNKTSILVSEILRTKVGDYYYPGDKLPSPNWPKMAPGRWGIVNAFSPKYCDLSAFAEIDPRPDVLWVRGADDRTVSDASAADFGYLGKIGMVPDWPGEEIYPPQPMVSQICAVLDEYAVGGGNYREEIFANCGHSPHIERPDAFRRRLIEFLP